MHDQAGPSVSPQVMSLHSPNFQSDRPNSQISGNISTNTKGGVSEKLDADKSHILEISDDDDEDMIEAKRLSMSINKEDVVIVRKKSDNNEKSAIKNFCSFSDSDSDDKQKSNKEDVFVVENKNEDLKKQQAKKMFSFSDSDSDDEDMKEAKRLSLSQSNINFVDPLSNLIDDNKHKTNQSPPKRVSIDNNDDDLPDLELPLFKRLLLKGNVKSQLLTNAAAATSENHSPKAISPINVDEEILKEIEIPENNNNTNKLKHIVDPTTSTSQVYSDKESRMTPSVTDPLPPQPKKKRATKKVVTKKTTPSLPTTVVSVQSSNNCLDSNTIQTEVCGSRLQPTLIAPLHLTTAHSTTEPQSTDAEPAPNCDNFLKPQVA